MKKIFVIILLGFLSSSVFAQTEIGNFKIVDGKVIWQKVFEQDLEIESQDVELRAVGLPLMTTTFWLSDIAGAKLKVDKKDGRTRLTFSDIFSISSTKLDFGQVEQNVKPSYLNEIYVNNKKGVFKNLFLKKDGKLINDIIELKIKELLDTDSDDW